MARSSNLLPYLTISATDLWYTFFMKRQDTLSVLFTFVVGFIAGMFLYLTHFGKLINDTAVTTQADVDSLSIVGEAYGKCGSDCPSFQVLADGSYRFQYAEVRGGEKVIKSGTLPLQFRRSLDDALNPDDLEEQSTRVEPTGCNSRQNGIDVRYDITLEGEDFNLDSCGTAVDGKGKIWTTLSEVWKYFDTVQR